MAADLTTGDHLTLSGIRMECRITHPNAKLPVRGKPNDAGYDIASITDVLIRPGETAKIETGIELACPPGFYWTMEGRSCLNDRRLFVVRPIIDATYCGPAFVYLRNESRETYRSVFFRIISYFPFLRSLTPPAAYYQVRAGDRIAQILLHRVLDMDVDTVSTFSPLYSQRGTAGFGSTGR